MVNAWKTQYIISGWLHTPYQTIFIVIYWILKISSLFDHYLWNSPVKRGGQPHGSDQCGYIHLLYRFIFCFTVVGVEHLCRLGCQETFVSSSSSQSPSPHGGSAEVWATRWRLVPIVNTSTLHSTQHKLKHNADTSQVMKFARYIRNSCKILHDKIFPSLEIESGSYHTLTSLHQVRNTQLLNIQSGDVAAPSD